jgi:hypothetical protein
MSRRRELLSAFTGMLSAIDRNHCPPLNGTPVRHHRNTHKDANRPSQMLLVMVRFLSGGCPETAGPLPICNRPSDQGDFSGGLLSSDIVALFRLTTSSNLVGSSIGISDALLPFKSLLTTEPARRHTS